MYAGNDLQAVQLLPGGGCMSVSSNAGAWTQGNSSSSSGRIGKGARGGSASKGVALPTQAITPITPAGRQVTYIDATTGQLVAPSGTQTFSRPGAPKQSGRPGQQAPNAPSQPSAIVQVHGFQQNGQQAAATQQVLQMHSATAGAQMYKLTNGTRVVKAGQPYPNTTIVQTAVAVPAGPSQSQAQGLTQQQSQQVGLITIRSQNMSMQQQLQQSQPPQQQLQPHHQQQQQQPQPQQQLGQQQMQGLQMQLGSAIQVATSAGSAQQQQQQQQAKVTILQQAPPQPQTHVLVAQPQTQIIHHMQQPLLQMQQQPPQQLQGKQQQQRPGAAAPPFQAVTVRQAGVPGTAAAATIRPMNGGPITLTTVYTPPPTVTTVVRPAVRIPKLGTVATYNPVTGVRSATTSTGAPGGSALPLLPANLPPSLVQQVHKANLLQQQQQQQQQHTANAAAVAAATNGGLKAVLQLQPQLPGQAVRPVGAINAVVTTTASNAPVAGGGMGPQQRQTTLVVGSAGGVPMGAQQQPTQMGITVVGGSLQHQMQPQVQQLQTQMQQVVQTTNGQLHLVTTGGGPKQQQLQQVHITLADGTTATTVMDQATLSRMLSDASRGPPGAKLSQARQPQQAASLTAGQVQMQLQALSLQQQQQQHTLLQATPPQNANQGLLNVLGGVAGGGCGGNGSGSNSVPGKASGGSGGLEHVGGGLQTIHLPGAAVMATGATSGPAQVLIRSTSQMSSGSASGATHGQQQQQQSGLPQMATLRTMQMLGLSASQGNLQLQQAQKVDFMPGAPQQQQQQLLQLQLQQHSLEQQQHHHHQQQQQQAAQLLQLQQQMSQMGRRPSGTGVQADAEAAAAASLLDPSAMTLAQLPVFGVQQRLQQPQQQMQQQQHHHLSSVVEGLSVVDLDGDPQQQRLHQQRLQQQQQQQLLGAMQNQQQRSQQGAAAGGSSLSGGLLNGGGINTGRLDSSGSYSAAGALMLAEDAAAAMAAAANMGPGGGDPAAAAASQAGAFGIGAGDGGDVSGSKEDLKAILVSIGQELARHGISVETAVTSGWLGVLTAMDVAVLADAYTEERRLLMQQNAQPPQGAASQQQQQQHLPQQQAGQSAQQQSESGAGVDSRSGSNADRNSAATGGMAALTCSSARTSMSVAPSEDGASTTSGGGGGSAAATAAESGAVGAQGSNGGAGSGGLYDLSKFNAFQYGFLGAGMLSSLGGGGAFGSEVDKLWAGRSESYRDADAAAMADVFGEKPWPPFGMPVMAEEVGLSAQPHLQGYRHQLPPPHAASLLGGRSGGNGSGGNGAAPKLIDSASEYEARMPLMQVGQRQQLLQPGGGRFTAPEMSNPLQLSGGGACTLHTAMSAPSVGGTAKGCFSSAPSAGSGSAGGGAEDAGKEIENRFANLDLGCGFY